MRLAVAEREIRNILSCIDLPKSNDAPLITTLYMFATEKLLTSLAKQYSKGADQVKKIYAEQLNAPSEQFTLHETVDFVLNAKVGNPRESFDKDAFITTISENYNISVFDLKRIAMDCTKQSACPITLTCENKL